MLTLRTNIEFALNYFIFNTDKFTKEDLVSAICTDGGKSNEKLKVSSSYYTKFVKNTFIDKQPRISLRKYLLHTIGMHECTKCKYVFTKSMFNTNNTKAYNLGSNCKSCILKAQRLNAKTYTLNTANYRAAKSYRTPKWADLSKIKTIYNNCPIGFQVDHIIPLRGKIVSGLHVETNLQYLTKEDNIRKNNKF